MLEIYTTGGGELVAGALNAMAAFTGTSTYNTMVYLGILAGVIAFAFQIGVMGNLRGVGQTFLLILVISGVSLGPKQDVVIIDLTDRGVLPNRVVANVPYSLAWVYSLTSSTSFYVAERLEVLLGTPEATRYSLNGMGFGAKLTSQAAQWEMASTTLKQTMRSFMEQCVVDPVSLRLFSAESIREEGDLYGSLGALVPVNTYFVNTVTGNFTACRAGWTDLQDDLDDAVEEVLTRQSMARVASSTNFNNPANLIVDTDFMEDATDAALAAATNGAETAQTYLRQAMLLQSLDSGIRSSLNGSPAALQDYLTARADAQTRGAYQTTGMTAEKWVPMLKIVFEVLYVCSFPLLLLLIFTPLGPTVVKSYFGGFVWLASWEPISAALHYLVSQSSAGWYRDVLTSTTGGAFNGFILNFNNHMAIRSIEADVAAMAGYMMSMVPFLALALCFGATRMTGMATGMLNVDQGSAMAAGQMAASGNISHGNVSTNNVNANKYDTDMHRSAGRLFQTTDNGAVAVTNRDGSLSIQGGTAVSNTGRSFSITDSTVQNAREAYDTSVSNRQEIGQTRSETINNVTGEMVEFSQTFGRGTNSGGRATFSNDSSMGAQTRESIDAMQSFADRNNISIDQAYRFALSGSAGAGVGTMVGPRASGSLEGSGTATGSVSEGASIDVSASERAELSRHAETISRSMSESNYGSSVSTGEQGTSQTTSRWDRVQSANDSYTQARSEEERHSRTLDTVETLASSQSVNLNNAVIDSMRDQGYTADEISRFMNPRGLDDEQFQFDNMLSMIGSMSPQSQQQFQDHRAADDGQTTRLMGTPGFGHEDVRAMLPETDHAAFDRQFADAQSAQDRTATFVEDQSMRLGTEGERMRADNTDTIEDTRSATETRANRTLAQRAGDEASELGGVIRETFGGNSDR